MKQIKNVQGSMHLFNEADVDMGEIVGIKNGTLEIGCVTAVMEFHAKLPPEVSKISPVS